MRGDSDRTGLLIVDLQAGFAPKAALVAAIREERTHHAVVAMTRFTNPPQSLYRKVLEWHGDGGMLLLPPEGAIVLDKVGYGLTMAHLEVLKAQQCTTWHICGMETEACVLACGFSLWDAGIRPIIRPEICAGRLHDEGVAVAVKQFGLWFGSPRLA